MTIRGLTNPVDVLRDCSGRRHARHTSWPTRRPASHGARQLMRVDGSQRLAHLDSRDTFDVHRQAASTALDPVYVRPIE